MCLNRRSLALMFFIIIAVCPDPSASWEYCKPEIHKKLCNEKKNQTHTVCDPSKAFNKNTVDCISEKFLAHVPVTRKFVREILHIHNDYRNRVAGGGEINTNIPNSESMPYPIASRMRVLIWDTELMYVSHIHTRQVKMGHDYCRNTQRYRYSGQNLGWEANNATLIIMDYIKKQLHNMYVEKDLIKDPAATVAKLASAKGFGHFTQLMNDRTSRVGCAVSLGANCFRKSTGSVNKWCYYLGCNYDGANMPGTPIYLTDPSTPGSKCAQWEVGKSTVYTNLCANSGKYFDPEEELNIYRAAAGPPPKPDSAPEQPAPDSAEEQPAPDTAEKPEET